VARIAAGNQDIHRRATPDVRRAFRQGIAPSRMSFEQQNKRSTSSFEKGFAVSRQRLRGACPSVTVIADSMGMTMRQQFLYVYENVQGA